MANGNAGLGTFGNQIIFNWIAPVFLVGVAAFAIVFIKDRAWMKLLTFVGIASIVGVLIFAGSSFFGQRGILTNAARQQASELEKGGDHTRVGGNTIILDGVSIPLK